MKYTPYCRKLEKNSAFFVFAARCFSATYAVVRYAYTSVCHVQIVLAQHYGDGCFGRRIGNRTQAFQWYYFRLPLI